MRFIYSAFVALFMIMNVNATNETGTTFPQLGADLKTLADKVDQVDHTIASQDISADNVDVYVSNILKAIDTKDHSFFAKIKSSNAIGVTGLNCLADCINAMGPTLRDKMKGALKKVVPLIGYGAHTVDLFIS